MTFGLRMGQTGNFEMAQESWSILEKQNENFPDEMKAAEG
jgi:hypothetical protein